jgi:intergrase/recombinase
LTGLRKNEALQAFNMIIDLAEQDKLGEFYNRDIQALEFYNYPQFNRRTKKVFLSFVSKEMVDEIADSQPVSYYAIRKRLTSRKLPVRIKELRSYFTTYLRQNGVLPETVNLLQGRIDARDIQLVHYFKIADMQQLSQRILAVTEKLQEVLTAGA